MMKKNNIIFFLAIFITNGIECMPMMDVVKFFSDKFFTSSAARNSANKVFDLSNKTQEEYEDETEALLPGALTMQDTSFTEACRKAFDKRKALKEEPAKQKKLIKKLTYDNIAIAQQNLILDEQGKALAERNSVLDKEKGDLAVQNRFLEEQNRVLDEQRKALIGQKTLFMMRLASSKSTSSKQKSKFETEKLALEKKYLGLESERKSLFDENIGLNKSIKGLMAQNNTYMFGLFSSVLINLAQKTKFEAEKTVLKTIADTKETLTKVYMERNGILARSLEEARIKNEQSMQKTESSIEKLKSTNAKLVESNLKLNRENTALASQLSSLVSQLSPSCIEKNGIDEASFDEINFFDSEDESSAIQDLRLRNATGGLGLNDSFDSYDSKVIKSPKGTRSHLRATSDFPGSPISWSSNDSDILE